MLWRLSGYWINMRCFISFSPLTLIFLQKKIEPTVRNYEEKTTKSIKPNKSTTNKKLKTTEHIGTVWSEDYAKLK